MTREYGEGEVRKRELLIIKWLRANNEDGTPCSADRELLAQRLERREHLK